MYPLYKWPSMEDLPNVSAAYVLFDKNGVCLYVGSTFELRNRLKCHHFVERFDSCRWVTCPPAQLEAKERELFNAGGPTLNKCRIQRPKRELPPYVKPAIKSGTAFFSWTRTTEQVG